MFYLCVRTHNHAATVGLLLWKIRQVFAENPREYRLLVADDGSTDDTAEVLDRYRGALDLTIVRHETPRGYAASMARLFRTALERSDRPRRDCAVTFNADYSVSPGILPELVRRFESGADLVIAEAPDVEGTVGGRIVRRFAPSLLRPGVEVPGVHDLLSGVCAVRLVTLKRVFKRQEEPLFETQGEAQVAELVVRLAAEARQIAAVDIPLTSMRPEAIRRPSSFRRLLSLYRAGRLLQLPIPDAAVQRAS